MKRKIDTCLVEYIYIYILPLVRCISSLKLNRPSLFPSAFSRHSPMSQPSRSSYVCWSRACFLGVIVPISTQARVYVELGTPQFYIYIYIAAGSPILPDWWHCTCVLMSCNKNMPSYIRAIYSSCARKAVTVRNFETFRTRIEVLPRDYHSVQLDIFNRRTPVKAKLSIATLQDDAGAFAVHTLAIFAYNR